MLNYGMRQCIRSAIRSPALLAGCLVALGPKALADESTALAELLNDPAMRLCLERSVARVENLDRSVAELLQECEPVELAESDDPDTLAAAEVIEDVATTTSVARFFQPYKDNYLVFGRMRNRDGTISFSGEKLDTKFALGLNFGPFADIDELSWLTPLRFGYSQRSWWNIAEDSAPFTEHNYNPELFWEFTQPDRPLFGRFPFIDLAGIEHESNGQDGDRSRSWDRIYIQKDIQLTPQFNMTVKLWDILETGKENEDIRHYLGSGHVALEFQPNERTRVRVRLQQGNNVEKVSYQADIIYRRPMVNTAFFLTYYDGYGEALINYNRKSRSLRAGFYFPLEQLL